VWQVSLWPSHRPWFKPETAVTTHGGQSSHPAWHVCSPGKLLIFSIVRLIYEHMTRLLRRSRCLEGSPTFLKGHVFRTCHLVCRGGGGNRPRPYYCRRPRLWRSHVRSASRLRSQPTPRRGHGRREGGLYLYVVKRKRVVIVMRGRTFARWQLT
jgi:hypothetical protein